MCNNFAVIFCLALIGFGDFYELPRAWYPRPKWDTNEYAGIQHNVNYQEKTGGLAINKSNQCSLNSCKRATSQMLVMMDHDSSSCEDFHKLVCGGSGVNNKENLLLKKQFSLLKNHLIDSLRRRSSTGYLKTFSNFYTSCLYYDMEFNLDERMTFVNNYSESNITKIFSDLILTQSMPFFDIGLDIGKDSKYKIQITLPGESSLETTTRILDFKEKIKIRCLDIMSNINDLDELHSNFKSCVKKSIKNHLHNFLKDSAFLGKKQNLIDSDTLLHFIEETERIWPNDNKIQQTTINKGFNAMTVMDLNAKFGIIDWKIFFRILSNKTFDTNETIQVYFPDYIDNLFQIFRKYYLVSDTNSQESKLVRILRSFYSSKLYENTITPLEIGTRDDYCIHLSSQLMPDLTTDIMFQIHRQNDLHPKNHKTEELFELIIKQLSNSFRASNLSENIHRIFQDHLKTITLGILSAGNSNALQRIYGRLEISENQYQKDILKLLIQFRRTIYSLVNSKVSPATLLNYFLSPFETLPKAFYGSNYIVFHPAIYLRTSEDLPEYLRISKQGLHLSRELVKHFDIIGKYYLNASDDNEINTYYKVLDSLTKELLEKMYLNHQYQLNGIVLTFQVISGPLLVNELIVDNAAFRLITECFEELTEPQDVPWINSLFSPIKIFVITAAQEFCNHSPKELFMFNLYDRNILPSEIKIQNIVSNFAKFKNIFACVEGSAMVLDESVIVQFPYVQIEEDFEDYGGDYIGV